MSGNAREHLLGYALGALDHHDHSEVERALRSDPRMMEELERVRRHVALLELDRELHEPPHGLAHRTCRCLSERFDELLEMSHDDLHRQLGAGFDERRDEGSFENDAQFENDDERDSKIVDKRRSEAGRATDGGRRAAMAGDVAAQRADSSPRPLSTLREFASVRHWNFADYVVATGIVLASAFLFFPAIAHSRYRSQVVDCQNNLRQVGMALANYAEIHGGYFPQLATSGKRAIAGVFGPVLRDEGFLTDDRWLKCSASYFARREAASTQIPSLKAIDAADGEQLVELQRRAGGSYGYSLGHVEGGRYQGPRNNRRSFYALVADAPSWQLAGHQSENHGGRGQNVLFEDGHVTLIVRSAGDDVPDAIYMNRDGRMEAANDPNDSVIGRSETPPLPGR